jgi:hypothetical protein
LSGCSTGMQGCKPPCHAGLYTVEHSVPSTYSDNPDLRSGCDGSSPMGHHIRLSHGQRIHCRQGIVAQPPCGRGNGNETQRSHGQYNHANWTVDVFNVPHLHPLPNWSAIGRCGLENVPTIHISKCWVTGGGLRNQVIWVIPGPMRIPAPRYKSPGRAVWRCVNTARR